jgi:hypothetical protein
MGLGIIVAILVGLLGAIGFIIFPLGLFGIFGFLWENIKDFFSSVKRIIYWPSNSLYSSWARYGKSIKDINEIEEIFFDFKNKEEYLYYDSKWIVNKTTGGFIKFKDIKSLNFNLVPNGDYKEVPIESILLIVSDGINSSGFYLGSIALSAKGFISAKKIISNCIRLIKNKNNLVKINYSEEIQELFSI